MPKLRIPAKVRGAKSIAVRVANKLGGRKNKGGTTSLTNAKLIEAVSDIKRKRDTNKLMTEFKKRGLVLPVAGEPAAV
jgi:hypothetical protein